MLGVDTAVRSAAVALVAPHLDCCRSRQEKQESFDFQLTSKKINDDFLELDMSLAQNKNLGRDWFLADTDIVLLSNNGKNILAKVQKYQSMPQGAMAILRCFVSSTNPDPGLHINTVWHLSKVFRCVIAQYVVSQLC